MIANRTLSVLLLVTVGTATISCSTKERRESDGIGAEVRETTADEAPVLSSSLELALSILTTVGKSSTELSTVLGEPISTVRANERTTHVIGAGTAVVDGDIVWSWRSPFGTTGGAWSLIQDSDKTVAAFYARSHGAFTLGECVDSLLPAGTKTKLYCYDWSDMRPFSGVNDGVYLLAKLPNGTSVELNVILQHPLFNETEVLNHDTGFMEQKREWTTFDWHDLPVDSVFYTTDERSRGGPSTKLVREYSNRPFESIIEMPPAIVNREKSKGGN